MVMRLNVASGPEAANAWRWSFDEGVVGGGRQVKEKHVPLHRKTQELIGSVVINEVTGRRQYVMGRRDSTRFCWCQLNLGA
jgi:hypothetical protein